MRVCFRHVLVRAPCCSARRGLARDAVEPPVPLRGNVTRIHLVERLVAAVLDPSRLVRRVILCVLIVLIAVLVRPDQSAKLEGPHLVQFLEGAGNAELLERLEKMAVRHLDESVSREAGNRCRREGPTRRCADGEAFPLADLDSRQRRRSAAVAGEKVLAWLARVLRLPAAQGCEGGWVTVATEGFSDKSSG